MISQSSNVESQQIPPQIYQLSLEHSLGTLNTVYKPRISSALAVVGIALGIILADIVLFAIIVLLGYILYILIVIPIVAIIYLIMGTGNASFRVYEFTNGLVRVKSGKTEVIRWDQMAEVWQQTKTSTSTYAAGGVLGALLFGGARQVYTVRRYDGATFKFESAAIKDIDAFSQTLLQELAQIHIPLAISAFDNGNTIPFGPLKVSREGISNAKGALLPWHQVQGVNVTPTVVTVVQREKSRKWVSAPTAKVPNTSVLSELVQHAVQTAQV